LGGKKCEGRGGVTGSKKQVSLPHFGNWRSGWVSTSEEGRTRGGGSKKKKDLGRRIRRHLVRLKIDLWKICKGQKSARKRRKSSPAKRRVQSQHRRNLCEAGPDAQRVFPGGGGRLQKGKEDIEGFGKEDIGPFVASRIFARNSSSRIAEKSDEGKGGEKEV